MLKLMYITNDPVVARIAEDAGVDRIFVDMEYIGKAERQGGMNTVQNHHTPEDVRIIKNAVRRAEVLCRLNPIQTPGDYSEREIDAAVEAGADILMLPYFRTVSEVRKFLELVHGRVKTMLLVETPEAVDRIDDILELPSIDEVLIGLNDLSLGYGKKFMFELLSDGTVEQLCVKFKKKGIPYGFGGIAAPGKGALPAECIIREHCRMESTRVILSRSFCRTEPGYDPAEVRETFRSGVRAIRALERECEEKFRYFAENEKDVARRIAAIAGGKA